MLYFPQNIFMCMQSANRLIFTSPWISSYFRSFKGDNANTMSVFFSPFKSQFWMDFRLQFAIIAFIYLMHSTDNNKQTFYLCKLSSAFIHLFRIEKWKCNPCFFTNIYFWYRKPKAKIPTIELMQIFKTDNLVANRHTETHWGIKKYTQIKISFEWIGCDFLNAIFNE